MEWISVKDQPIPEDTQVLAGIVSNVNGERLFQQHIIEFSSDEFCLLDSNGDYFTAWEVYELDYWMHLPTPPK